MRDRPGLKIEGRGSKFRTRQPSALKLPHLPLFSRKSRESRAMNEHSPSRRGVGA